MDQVAATRRRLCEEQWAKPGVAWPMHVAGWIDAQWWRDAYQRYGKESPIPENHLQKERGRAVVPKPKKPKRPRKPRKPKCQSS